MQQQSGSSSLEMGGSQESQNEVDNRLNDINRQYIQVRRPNEDNVLEFLAYDDVKNDSPLKGSPTPYEEELLPDQTSQVHFQPASSPLKVMNTSISKRQAVDTAIWKGKSKMAIIEGFIKKLKSQSHFMTKPDSETLRLLYDKTVDFTSIQQRKDLPQWVFLVWNSIYLTISLALVFSSTFTIFFKYDQQTAILIIALLIYLLDHYFQWKSKMYTIQVLIIILIIIALSIENVYAQIPLLLQVLLIIPKYRSVSQLIREIYYLEFILIEVMFAFYVFAHLWACIYHLVHEDIEYRDCLVWSMMNLSTIGSQYDKDDANLTCLLIMSLVGTITYTIFSAILNTELSYQYHKNSMVLNNYLSKRNIAPSLQMKIKQELQTIWKGQLNSIEEENRIVTQLSNQLQQQVQINMFGRVLKSIPFFRTLSVDCQTALTLNLKEVHLLSDRILEPTGLYYIIEGRIKHSLPTGVFVKEQCEGFIGQGSLLFDRRPVCIAKSVTPVRVAFLSRHHFLSVMIRFPNDYVIVINIQQAYRMNLDQNTLDAGIQCPLCHKLHDLDNCKQLHFIPNRNNVILKHLYSTDEVRRPIQRQTRRTTNARFGHKLFEDAASMFQEQLSEDSESPQHSRSNIIVSHRKKSKSLNSGEESKFQKSLSNHSLSAIPKPPASSALSSSSFNIFKDQNRKISRQENSDKISSNSLKNMQPHKSSSSSGKKDLPLPMNIELHPEDSVILAQSKNRKSLIGKLTPLRRTPSPSQSPLQAIPSVSELQSEFEERSILRQYSMSSKISHPRSKFKGSSKFTGETNKQFEFPLDLSQGFEFPGHLQAYFPNQNYHTVIELYKQYQNK